MSNTKKDKKSESITDIINSLLKLTKGHERYPYDTVKLGSFPKPYPITYAQVKDLALRLRAAQRREKKRIEQMVHELYWKNKNVLRWRTALSDLEARTTGKVSAEKLRWAMIYASELQHLIHYYGFEKKYAERDSVNPYDTTPID